jgi:hypothetical protein
MTPDEREQMAILCERIASEQNPEKFTKWGQQLNELLSRKAMRLGAGLPYVDANPVQAKRPSK